MSKNINGSRETKCPGVLNKMQVSETYKLMYCSSERKECREKERKMLGGRKRARYKVSDSPVVLRERALGHYPVCSRDGVPTAYIECSTSLLVSHSPPCRPKSQGWSTEPNRRLPLFLSFSCRAARGRDEESRKNERGGERERKNSLLFGSSASPAIEVDTQINGVKVLETRAQQRDWIDLIKETNQWHVPFSRKFYCTF